MNKMKNWLAVLLVVLLLPGMAMAETWQFSPDRSTASLGENVRWLSVSPNGTYLFGIGGEGCDQTSPYSLYNTRTGELKPVKVPVTEDERVHSLFHYAPYNYGMLSEIVVHWSPDERYFTFSNYDAHAELKLGSIHALYIGETETASLSIAAEWDVYLIKSNYGSIINACFAPDSSALYFTFYNGDVFEEPCVVARYDLQSGEMTQHFPAMEPVGQRFVGIQGRSLVAVSDDVFLMTGNQNAQLTIVRRQDSDWNYEHLLGREDSSRAAVKFVEYSADSGMGILYCHVNSGSKTTPVVYVFRMDPQGNVTSLRGIRTYGTPMNVRLSPDGRYALLLLHHFDIHCSRMEMVDLETLERTDVDVSAMSSYELQEMEFCSGFSSWKNGFYWGGEYLLSGVYDKQLLKAASSPDETIFQNGHAR